MAMFFSFLDLWFSAAVWAFAVVIGVVLLVLVALLLADTTTAVRPKRRSRAATRIAGMVGAFPRPWVG